MRTHTSTLRRAAFAAALLMAVPAAHSQMYRWIDAQGSVTYSNDLPSDMSVVKDLTVVLESPGTIAAPDKRGSEAASASSLPALSEPPQASSSPRIAIAPNAPEAVRDPCLRS